MKCWPLAVLSAYAWEEAKHAVHLRDQQLVHEVRQAVLRHEGLHDVLVCPALSALVRLHVQPLQRIVLAQPCCTAHLHAAMHSPG